LIAGDASEVIPGEIRMLLLWYPDDPDLKR
jgi:hypothetical protein